MFWLYTKIHTNYDNSHDKFPFVLNATGRQEYNSSSSISVGHSDLKVFNAVILLLACYLGKTVYATKVNFISTVANKQRVAF